MSRWNRSAVPSVLAAAFVCLACGEPAPPPNLLLITIDTLRADHLSAYGYPKQTSPAIDTLASQGATFERAFAQRGVTWSSLASIMTSRYPVAHGVRTNGVVISPEQTQLAEILQQHGYTTGAITYKNVARQRWEGFPSVQITDDPGITGSAFDWLAVHGSERFFLWLHYHKPHSPYDPPPEFANRFPSDYRGPLTGEREVLAEVTFARKELSEEELSHIVALYDGETAYADHQVDLVLKNLERLGLDRNTLVVLTSDHGEDLGQHNSYFFHLASVYDTSLHIPLIFRLPGVVPAGLSVDTLLESIDIAPTILTLLGIPIPDSFQGSSLVPLLEGQSLDLGPAFSEWEDRILTIRTERYRYVFNPTGHHPTWIAQPPGDVEGKRYPIDTEELYDLQSDPGETRNLARDRPEVTARLRAELERWQESNGWTLHGAEPVEIDPRTREELEALGYVF